MRALIARLGAPTFGGGVAAFLAGPACLTCTLPMLWGGLAAVGLFGVALSLHNLTLPIAVLATVVLARNRRKHAQAAPLAVAAAGVAFLVVHFALHFAPGVAHAVWVVADWAGVALLVAAVALDWRALHAWAVACEAPASPAPPTP